MINYQDIVINKILHILYNGAVPVDRLDEANALREELRPIVQRAFNKPKSHRECGPISEESAKITARIVELYGDGPKKGGLSWTEIVKVLEKEGVRGQNNRPLSIDAVCHRYRSWQKQAGQKGERAGSLPQTANVKVEVPNAEEVIQKPDCPHVAEVADLGPVCPECKKPLKDAGHFKVSKGLIIYCSKACADKTAPLPTRKGEIKSDPKTDSTIISMKKRGMNWAEIADTLNRRWVDDMPHHKARHVWTANEVKARHAELTKGAA